MTQPRKALLFHKVRAIYTPSQNALSSMAEAFELPRRALPGPWMCACALPRATMRSAAACSTSC